MKLTMVLVMIIAHTPLEFTAGMVLEPLVNRPKAKLIIVMIVTPFLMNTFQLWLTDNFIKKQTPARSSNSPRVETAAVTIVGSGTRNLGLMAQSVSMARDLEESEDDFEGLRSDRRELV
eukprot:GHVS01084796.1.p1 GENE.GHVS01084796.1~~GHVS01084796.1.p1  ORF type:complete len:119 (+),score=12.44 GHVS01084796.1:638-994(+)